MRDAFGGITNLAIIVVFLTLVSGYLAFNVNYTKAFRVKNKIISTIEQYEGECKIEQSNECHKVIQSYMNSLGYNAPHLNLTDEENGAKWDCGENAGYCIKKINITPTSTNGTQDIKERAYFKVVTQINIDIPIINKILPGLKIFQVSGDTKPIVLVP